MKLHRPTAQQVVLALKSTFGVSEDGRSYYADKVIERLFKNNSKLGARDRRFIAETTYGIVRWWRLLWASLGHDIPAQVDEGGLWRILGAWLILDGVELPDWLEFRNLDRATLERHREDVRRNPAIRESIPDWLFEVGNHELKERWLEVLPKLNKVAPVVLRANRLKITREELQTELRREDIETFRGPDLNDGLVLKERRNVFTTECFKLGYFEVQDGASQSAAVLLDPQPGDRVVDACAGAGGKSLHLAALMRNKGKIIAFDIHQAKLEELRKRCTRAGVDIVEVRLIDSNKSVKRLANSADRLLLDVPCSGLGVLRRNPDTKWKLKPEDLPRMQALQRELLDSYSQMLRAGGRMVYSTCSILPSENSDQVKAFLATRSDTWKLIEEHQYWPGDNDYDGFYAAALERIK